MGAITILAVAIGILALMGWCVAGAFFNLWQKEFRRADLRADGEAFWTKECERLREERDELLRQKKAISIQATEHRWTREQENPNPSPRRPLSGAQLRHLNDQQNARYINELEQRPNSEILAAKENHG